MVAPVQVARCQAVYRIARAQSSPHCAALPFPPWPRVPPCRRHASPLRRFPPCARPSFPPDAAPSSSPPCAAATLPPLRGSPPYARRCRAATLTLAPLRVAREMAAPASATAQPLARLGAACAGGWPSSPRRHAFGVHGWAPGGTRSRGARSPRGPVPCGQSGPREDRRGVLRGSLPRSSALRASGGGARVLVHTGIAVCKAHGCSILLPRQEAVLFHTSKAGEYKILKQLFLHLGR